MSEHEIKIRQLSNVDGEPVWELMFNWTPRPPLLVSRYQLDEQMIADLVNFAHEQCKRSYEAGYEQAGKDMRQALGFEK